ncbi:MAG: MBL fold metallo-hydrolase [Planctomycetales bacterium]|nr:MBL fold metallo-hydrolase [Planctomycetales bacterium]
MKITVIGAAGGEVTGSAYVVQTSKARVLVDCGLFQGGKRVEAKNRPPAKVQSKLDAVVITHGHLDHTGRLPLLAKLGYQRPVFATKATHGMTGLILRDCARIQEQDAERYNRRRLRAGEKPQEPLFTSGDVETILGAFKIVPYQKPISIAPGVKACFAEAGHMLGSASIQLIVDEDGRQKKVVFSGDLGPRSVPILRDFEPFHAADAVFVESTYGDHDHRSFQETVEEFADLVGMAVAQGGKILIPTFAVGRAQLLIALLSWMFRRKKVKPFPVFLDSPMAIEATKLYAKHRELFDDQMLKYIQEKPLREDLQTLKACVSPDQSKAINFCEGSCLVMAGAGMCNAGRILHHFKQNLWKPETFVLMVGYQARGTLGRLLVDGATDVNIFGEKVAVKATIRTLGGFSAHAGQTDLLNWVGAIAASKPMVILTHGEDRQRNALAQCIKKQYRLKTLLPMQGDTIEI